MKSARLKLVKDSGSQDNDAAAVLVSEPPPGGSFSDYSAYSDFVEEIPEHQRWVRGGGDHVRDRVLTVRLRDRDMDAFRRLQAGSGYSDAAYVRRFVQKGLWLETVQREAAARGWDVRIILERMRDD